MHKLAIFYFDGTLADSSDWFVTLPFRGVEELLLKRSMVNSRQRLELAGFSAARLP